MNESERFRAASSPETSKEELRFLSVDASIIVRGAVACNASTPEDCIEILKTDENEYVRDCASQHALMSRIGKRMTSGSKEWH